MKNKRITRVVTGRLVQAVVYTSPSVNDKPRQRADKQKASSAARERINARLSWQKLERVLADNFDDGDLWITLTYSDDWLPQNRADATKMIQKFCRAFRVKRKAAGQELKYVYTTEHMTSKDHRYHHHLVVNGTGDDLAAIRACWPYGQSLMRVLSFDADHTYEDLARYMTKEPRQFGNSVVGARTWSPSRNLKHSRPESELVEDYITLTIPPNAVILVNEPPVRNGWGEYAYIKYMLPDPIGQRPHAKRRRKPKPKT